MSRRRVYNKKSSNLVFHADFNNADPIDVISGQRFVANGNQFTWSPMNYGWQCSNNRASNSNTICATISGLNLGLPLGSPNITISMTFKVLAYNFSYLYLATNNLEEWMYVLSVSNQASDNVPVVSINEKITITMTLNGNELKYYKNGILDRTLPTVAQVAASNNQTFVLGGSPNFNGCGTFFIYDYKIFNKALSEQEIQGILQ